MTGKSKDLLFSSQQLTSQHKLLGDTTAVGSDRGRVQMPSLGSPWAALPKHCHPGWPSTLLLGEWARLFSMPRAARCSLRLRAEASTLVSLVGWMGSWFPQDQCTKEKLETRLPSHG